MMLTSAIEMRPFNGSLAHMNYRHAYHAGNFADVLKHTVLTRCLVHLKEKPAPFRVIDTHAGIGLYDLGGDAARRTGEAQTGIAKLEAAVCPADVAVLLEPYFEALEKTRAHHGALAYPGSPAIVEALLRGEDRLIANELHPDDFETLRENFSFDGRVKTLSLDAATALNSSIPPKERRGLVLIDPPYEKRDEFSALVDMIVRAHRKWSTGIYAIWYPVKSKAETAWFFGELRKTAIPKILRIEQTISEVREGGALTSSGLIVINPPWRLSDEMKKLLPWLDQNLALGAGHNWNVDWIAGETSTERNRH